MGLRPITEAKFLQAQSKDSYYDSGRWDYYTQAIQFAGSPLSVLELGPHMLPLFPGGHTMDVSPAVKPTYLHDARKCPWPVGRRYELFIGLQVWEHLGDAQVQAFQEVQRLAAHAILSFPFNWQPPQLPDHCGITNAVIAKWTCHVPSTRVHIDSRVICYFEQLGPSC